MIMAPEQIADVSFKDRFGAGFNKSFVVFSSFQVLTIAVLVGWYYITSHKLAKFQQIVDEAYNKRRVTVKHSKRPAVAKFKPSAGNLDGAAPLSVLKCMRTDPEVSKEAMQLLLTRANCDYHISHIPGATVSSRDKLGEELKEIQEEIQKHLDSFEAEAIPVAVMLLRLRTLIRGYHEANDPGIQVCVKTVRAVVTLPGFYKLDETDYAFEFWKDVAYFLGSDLEGLSPLIVPNLVSSYSDRFEAPILMFLAYVSSHANMSAILRFITQKQMSLDLKDDKRKVLFKALLILCSKPGLSETHHINIRHIIGRFLRDGFQEHAETARFIFWKYSELYPHHASVLKDNLPTDQSQALEENQREGYCM